MENIVLTVHLILASALILSVLLQRSEGGGLGIGGGGGAMSGRAPTSPMAKLTWFLAVGFLATSLALTWVGAQNSAGRSVIDRVGTGDAPAEAPADPLSLPPGLSGDLLPPGPADAPTAPPADEPTPPPAQ